ncbi:ribonuclease H family protein [Ectobacillus sp. JY-23]|uniref:ribonuclease H family protein n=1 Tax=Ectobacillus sp. JY-23 TaxID=2933872 RepID=UPI001FF41A7B|nr:ribonuclease H family protein [Ectobacillus sp. JY-23]UOY93406.1 ribonuclease H family protein [Ectobacillus sp. JY-23]
MKFRLEWIYKTKSGSQLVLQSDYMRLEEALRFADDFEKTGRTKEIIFYDEMGTYWNKKEAAKLTKKVQEEPHDIILYFDGGYEPHTQRAGLGVSLYYTQNGQSYRMRRNKEITEIENNNEAEYAALQFGIYILEELGVKYQTVTLRGDSQVVLNQLAGEWPCYEKELSKYLDRIENVAKSLKLKYTCEPLSRKNNKEAHQLAKQALEGTAIDSHSIVSEE